MTSSGELPKRGFSPFPAPSRKLFGPMSLHRIQESATTGGLCSSKPRATLGPASLAPLPTGDGRTGVPCGALSGLGATNPVSFPLCPQYNFQYRAGLVSSLFVVAACDSLKSTMGPEQREGFPLLFARRVQPRFCLVQSPRPEGKCAEDAGRAAKLRAPASRGGNFLPPCGCTLAPAGPRPLLPRRCAAGAPRGRSRLCLGTVAPLPSDSQGFTADSPVLSRLLGQTSGPREKLRRGEDP